MPVVNSPENDIQIPAAHKAAERSKQRGQTIDWEHPDGSHAGQSEISSAECLEGCEGDLQEPAQKAAMDVIVDDFAHVLILSFWQT